MISLICKVRLWRWRRKQRKKDQEWLETNPDIGEILAERNRRLTEWNRWRAKL